MEKRIQNFFVCYSKVTYIVCIFYMDIKTRMATSIKVIFEIKRQNKRTPVECQNLLQYCVNTGFC